MKRVLAVFVITATLVACDNGSGTTEQKLDSLGEKFEKAAEKTWDSTKSKGKELIDKAKDRLDRDSARRDSNRRENLNLNKQ
jgi:hypothetical protein